VIDKLAKLLEHNGVHNLEEKIIFQEEGG